MLALSDVHTYYGKSHILHGVSLEVARGEVVGLLGRNGVGKSTTMRSIMGLTPPQSGRVTFRGTDITGWEPYRVARAGIGFVPEDRRAQGLHLDSSVADNLAIVWLRAWSRTDRRLRTVRAQRAVDRFAIRCRDIDTPVGDLSGGNQQKVLLARALARQPRVLLLDEPTRGVDIGAKHEIYRFVGGLVEDGVAVLLASSDLLELIGLCDRILVLHDGAIVADVPRSAATEERIAALAGGAEVSR